MVSFHTLGASEPILKMGGTKIVLARLLHHLGYESPTPHFVVPAADADDRLLDGF